MKKKSTLKKFKIIIKQFLSLELLDEIANLQETDTERTRRGLINIISGCKWQSNHFSIIAKAESGNVIGYAGFIQNESDSQKWLYTDLWVKADWRRQGVAANIIKKGIEYLSDIGAKTLCCCVDKDN